MENLIHINSRLPLKYTVAMITKHSNESARHYYFRGEKESVCRSDGPGVTLMEQRLWKNPANLSRMFLLFLAVKQSVLE